MNKMFSFIAGAVVGAMTAAMVFCDENKKRIKTTVSSYIDKMRKCKDKTRECKKMRNGKDA